MTFFKSLAISAVAAFLAMPVWAQERHALVVGINDYANLPSLQRAVNDARAVAATLGEAGFTVDAGFDLGRSEFVTLLSRFLARLAPEDEALIFYAGHAVAIEHQNYLVPGDASALQQSSEATIIAESIGQEFLLEQVTDTGVRLTVVIMDACRDNPFEGLTTRSMGQSRGLSVVEPPRGVFMMFSADQGQRALDGLGPDDDHPNSVFTRTLVPLLREPGLDIVDVARRLRGEVEDLARSVGMQQFPVYRDRMQGDGRFVIRPFDASGAASAAADPQAGAEEEADLGQLSLSPRRLSVGDELTVRAETPAGCQPYFFNLAADGQFTPLPLDFFQETALAGGRNRYVIDENSPFGLVVTPEDAPGHSTFGFLCPPTQLGTEDIRDILRVLRDGAQTEGTIPLGAGEVPFTTARFEILSQ